MLRAHHMSMLQAELYLRQLDDIAGETEALYAFHRFCQSFASNTGCQTETEVENEHDINDM